MSNNKKIYIDFDPVDNTTVYHYRGQVPYPIEEQTGKNSKKFWFECGGTALIETDKHYIHIDADGGVRIELHNKVSSDE